MENRENILENMGKLAKNSSYILSGVSTEIKNKVLLDMALALENNKEKIIAANVTDLENGKKNNMPINMLDRLMLDEKRISSMAEGLRELAKLPDPIGETLCEFTGAENIKIKKVRVPFGVIGIIYEARPNVTVDGAGISLKTGNAVILRGGSDAINSNLAIVEILQNVLEENHLPKEAVQILANTSREYVNQMMKLNQYIDVLIPRGGKGLIKNVVENATVPVIETGSGNCHIYVDEFADFNKAINILINGKVQRPAVCNALESLLINKNTANEFLPLAVKALREENVRILGCEQAREIDSSLELATEEDFYTEYNNLTITVKIIDDLYSAISHINKYSSHHSEVIITENKENADIFTKNIDSACCYVNASTRFTDGFQFGFGAEIGISTQKLHARGPMGLNEMTSYKYIVEGNGQIRK